MKHNVYQHDILLNDYIMTSIVLPRDFSAGQWPQVVDWYLSPVPRLVEEGVSHVETCEEVDVIWCDLIYIRLETDEPPRSLDHIYNPQPVLILREPRHAIFSVITNICRSITVVVRRKTVVNRRASVVHPRRSAGVCGCPWYIRHFP